MTHYLIYDPIAYDDTSFILGAGTEESLRLYDWFTNPNDAFNENLDTTNWTLPNFLRNNDTPDYILLTTFPSKPTIQQLTDYLQTNHPELLL